MNQTLDSHIRAEARQTIAMAPWCFGGATGCYFGVAPVAYLLSVTGLGLVFFAMIVTGWRWRRIGQALRICTTWAVIWGARLLWPSTHREPGFAVCQSVCVIFIVSTGLLWALRPWIYKFARLERPAP